MEEVKIAVDWWSKNIVKPKMDNGSNDRASMAIFSMVLFNLEEITEEQHTLFKGKLEELMLEEITKYGIASASVDYQPNRILSTAAEVASIGESHFPVKTSMRVEPGLVTVKHGYSAAYETLYESVEYWERQITQAEGVITRCKLDKISEFPQYTNEENDTFIRSKKKNIEEYKAEIVRVSGNTAVS